MEIQISLMVILGALLSLMLSAIAWFIRQLHQDFRNVQVKVASLHDTATLIQAESRLAYELMKLKLSFLEQKIDDNPLQKQNVKPLKKKEHENIK